MLFSFGEVTVRIAEIATSRQIPVSSLWQKYRSKEDDIQPNVELSIEKGSVPRCDNQAEGWTCAEAGKEYLAVYSETGKGVFALQYGRDDKAVRIIAVSDVGKSVRLGIQFGLLLSLRREYVGVHGVTLLCGNEIIILSAPSGTGKTTLARLLEEQCDAIVINGDFALLHPTEEGVIFEPTPFCGTSGRGLNQRCRVNRIVFLEQAKENTWRELNGREALHQLLNNTFVPTWDQGSKELVQENVFRCASMLRVNQFAFAPTQKAAEDFIQHIVH